MEHQQGQLTLTLGGQERTLFFDYTFVSIMRSKTPDGNFEKFLADNWEVAAMHIAHGALLAGDDVNDLPDGFSERMVGRWLFQLSKEDNAAIMEAYNTAMGFIIGVMTCLAKVVNVEEKPAIKKPKR